MEAQKKLKTYFCPMTIRTGSFMNVRASSSTPDGIVALNRYFFTAEFEHAATISSTYSDKFTHKL
jgi:hypothetical protein